jgi:hypothetical protein
LQHVIQGCHLKCCPACMYLLPLYAWEMRSRTHRLKSAFLPASGGTWNIICQHRATCVAVSLQTKCLLWGSLPNINKAGRGRRAEGSGPGCLSIVMGPPPQMVFDLQALSCFVWLALSRGSGSRCKLDMACSPNEIIRSKIRRSKKYIYFSICACHPCAGAMLIFSVSFQF